MNELQKLIQEQAEEILEQDMKMLDKGFTHRVTWWNHHMMGDDVQSDMYFGCDPDTLTDEDGDAWRGWNRIKSESTTVRGGSDYKVYKLSELDHR